MGQVDPCFSPFRDSASLDVTLEHTIGSEIRLVHLMVLLGDVGEVEAHFSPFRYSVNVDTR